MVNVQINDIEDHGNTYLVKIRETKTHFQRSFTIADKFYEIVHQYVLVRPSQATITRFFLNYRNGKCTNQIIGKNVFSQTPKKIATYLNLPDPERYTGRYL